MRQDDRCARARRRAGQQRRRSSTSRACSTWTLARMAAAARRHSRRHVSLHQGRGPPNGRAPARRRDRQHHLDRGAPGPARNVGYCTAKAGLLNFTRSVAMELAELRHPRQQPDADGHRSSRVARTRGTLGTRAALRCDRRRLRSVSPLRPDAVAADPDGLRESRHVSRFRRRRDSSRAQICVSTLAP